MTYKAQIRPLTEGVDALVGTDGNDTFQGIVGGAAATYNTFDSINGKGGDNTLNLVLDGDELPSETTIQNIQNVNLIAGTANLVTVNASTDFGAELKNLWQIGEAGAVTGLKADQTAGFRGETAEGKFDVTAATSAQSLSVALDGSTGVTGDDDADGKVELTVKGGNKLTTLNVAGSLAATEADDADDAEFVSQLTVNAAGATKLATLNLALESDTTLVTTSADSLVTINGADSSGNLTLVLGGLAAESKLETVEFGSGNDVFSIDVSAMNTELSVTGGAGADTFKFTVGGNVTLDDTETEITGLVTITDFGNGKDVLEVADFNGFTAQNKVDTLVENAVKADKTLEEILVELDTLLDGEAENITDFAQFTFDGDTYVFGSVDGADGADTLIKLAGVVDLNANNVVGLTE